MSRPPHYGRASDLGGPLSIGGPDAAKHFFSPETQQDLELLAAEINASVRGDGMVVLATPREGTDSGVWQMISSGISSGLQSLLKEVLDEPGVKQAIEQVAIVLTNELHKRPNLTRAIGALVILSQIVSRRARELTGITNQTYRIPLPEGFLGLRGGRLTLAFNEPETGSVLPTQLRLELQLSARSLVDVSVGKGGFRVAASHQFGAPDRGVLVRGELRQQRGAGFDGSSASIDARRDGHRLRIDGRYTRVDGILGTISYNSPEDGPQRILVVVTRDAGNVLRVDGKFAAELGGFGKIDGDFSVGNDGRPFTGVIAYNSRPGRISGGATLRRTATDTQIQARLLYRDDRVRAGLTASHSTTGRTQIEGRAAYKGDGLSADLVIEWDSGRAGQPVHVNASATWKSGSIGELGISAAFEDVVRVGVTWEHQVGAVSIGVQGSVTTGSATRPPDAQVKLTVKGTW